jgi:hypothetical protein
MRIVKITLLGALISIIAVAALAACRSYLYPFGRRPCTLQCMFGGLGQYAFEHDGWFPNSNRGPFRALQQLYPTNCSAMELAGVTGNIRAVERALEQGKALDGSLTSWVYIPGLRNDDPPDIAILWESRSGFYADGRRNFVGARPVLFLDGATTNIPAARWDTFVRNQEQMRMALFAKRAPERSGIKP